jgi:outer membrane protein assembly factor BamB
LWSVPTHDNIVATPVIAGDLVVVACEDRVVYALDAVDGSVRWTFEASGPLVSSPVLIGDTLVLGSDDQSVYGLDVATGSARWLAATPGAVEGPITASGSLAVIPSRDGSVSALDTNECPETCELAWSTTLGDAIRSAVRIIGSDAYVVSESGSLSSLDVATGRRNWTIGPDYIGPPAAVGTRLIVATRGGELHHVGWNGRVEAVWSVADARGPVDPAPEVSLGGIAADGAVWLADRRSVLWRLGPPLDSSVPRQLHVSWKVERSSLRGEAERFINTPVPYGAQLALVDSLRRAQLLDPRTGSLTIASSLPGDGLVSTIDPAVVQDRLVIPVAQSLVSSGLQTGITPWQVQADGLTNRPPATDGDSLYWITGSGEAGTAVLRALLAEDGSVRWSQRLAPTFAAGGAVVNNGIVFVSGPPSAYEAATGRLIWQADIPGLGLGGPVLDAERGRLYAGYAEASGRGAVAALDARTGSVIWTTALPEGVLSIVETLWLTPKTLVLPSFTGSVIGLDPENGAIRWQFRTPGARLGNSTVANGQVWLLQENGQIFVADADSGRLVARLTSQDVNVGAPGYRQRVHVDQNGAVAPLTHLLLGLELPH